MPVTAEQIQAMRDRGEIRSDWAAAAAMPQEDVERLADDDEGPLPPGWEDTVVLGVPEPAKSIHIRLDPVVLRWFKADGPGYQTRINAVLLAFVNHQQKQEATERARVGTEDTRQDRQRSVPRRRSRRGGSEGSTSRPSTSR